MPECNRGGDGAGALAHGVSVVAALNDPLRSGAARDDADVMAPDDDDTDAWPSGVMSNARPVAREPQIAPRHAEMPAEPPAAPRRGPCPRVARAMQAGVTTMLAQSVSYMMRGTIGRMAEVPVGTRFCAGLSKSQHTGGRDEGSDKFLLHHHS